MFKFCFPEKQFVIFRSQNKMCFTCLSLHISVNPVIIVSFYAHVLPDLFTLLELLLQCLDTWYPLINCSYCCHCSNSSLQPPAEPWQHLGFPSFLWRSDKCWKLGAVPETGWLHNKPADNHCLGSCTQSAWVSVSSVEFVLKESLHLTFQILRLLMIELQNDEFLLMILYIGDDLWCQISCWYQTRFRLNTDL